MASDRQMGANSLSIIPGNLGSRTSTIPRWDMRLLCSPSSRLARFSELTLSD